MIKTYNPTSAGIRFRKTLVKDVTREGPLRSLITALKGPAGRNHGTISSRHKSRGVRKFYRIVDFKREKYGIPAKVARIEHDPNRGPNIALLNYADGERRYILAPEGIAVGTVLMSGPESEISVGNALPLSKIPLGSFVHNIEINPGHGGQLVRSAGGSAILSAKEGNYVNITLPSGQVMKVLAHCYATYGVLGNADLRNTKLGKAGKQKYLGVRPHVRGVAMANPTDHPHAGSYRDNGIGGPSKSPWGKKTRGIKTRNRKHTNKFIVKYRNGK